MRMTEHMHSLWQVLGYDHPRDFFASGKLIDRFRELFSFAASIAFESPEAFGDRCGTGHGMQALRESHVMPVRKGQLDKLGAERAAECLRAQYGARGLLAAPDGDAPRMTSLKIRPLRIID
jgi:hypothetical protein